MMNLEAKGNSSRCRGEALSSPRVCDAALENADIRMWLASMQRAALEVSCDREAKAVIEEAESGLSALLKSRKVLHSMDVAGGK